MDKTEVFQILGIEETKEERALKNAYRERLAVTNPEDDPEGFKRLRAAYEEACRLARTQEQAQEQEKDDTPSGLFAEKAAVIYGDIRSRQDVAQWKLLFQEDAFVSLEEEEACRIKLLIFLMSHFKLPTEVWKLLDEKICITKGADAIKERFPADFVRYLVAKCTRGEDLDFSQFKGEPDAEYDLFIQYYERSWQAIQEGELKQAEECIRNADALHITHPALEICRANLYEKQGKIKEAVEYLQQQYRKYPQDAMISYNAAEILWRNAQTDPAYRQRAAEIYLAVKEETDSHYMANVRLTEWYYENGRFDEAKKCAEQVLKVGGDEEFISLLQKVNAQVEKKLEWEYREQPDTAATMELCWCYLQDGRNARGIRLARTLEKKLPPERYAEWNGLMAKLYAEQAEYEKSFEMCKSWESALLEKLKGEEGEERTRDLDRVRQSHMIRMQCLHNLGYLDKEKWREAIKEGEGLLEQAGAAYSERDIGICIEMIQIYTELEEYEKGLALVRKLLEDYRITAVYANALEIYRRKLEAGGVIKCASKCIEFFPEYAKAYEYAAKVYSDLEKKQELAQVLADAKKNGVKSRILDAYEYLQEHKPIDGDILQWKLKNHHEKYRQKAEDGYLQFYETGLSGLLELFYQWPDSYMLVELGIYYRVGHRYEEAEECFQKALQLAPANLHAFNGLSFVYRYTGEYEKALVCIKKAILYMDRDRPTHVYHVYMAELYSLLGDAESALDALQRVDLPLTQNNEWFWTNKARTLAENGRFGEAEDIYRKLYQPSDKRLFNRLAALFADAGQEEKLAALLQQNKPRLFQDKERQMYDHYDGWLQLLFGTRQKALKAFMRSVRREDGENAEKLAADAVFACILCEKPDKGRRYAAQLQLLLRRLSFEGGDRYYNRSKMRLQFEVLAAWYTAGDEELQKLLEKETCGGCAHCAKAVCHRLESVRILFMLRQGKREEAKERLARSLERQPYDRYLRAMEKQMTEMRI